MAPSDLLCFFSEGMGSVPVTIWLSVLLFGGKKEFERCLREICSGSESLRKGVSRPCQTSERFRNQTN